MSLKPNMSKPLVVREYDTITYKGNLEVKKLLFEKIFFKNFSFDQLGQKSRY